MYNVDCNLAHSRSVMSENVRICPEMSGKMRCCSGVVRGLLHKHCFKGRFPEGDSKESGTKL